MNVETAVVPLFEMVTMNINKLQITILSVFSII
jgi:hypothetical protein